jgi:hypothetical protein
MNNKWIACNIFAILALAGCANAPAPMENPCEPVFYVGCDDNTDALKVLEEYGFKQMTNSTKSADLVTVENGRVAYYQDGIADRFSNRIQNPRTGETWNREFNQDDSAVSSGFKFDGFRLFEQTYQRDQGSEYRGLYGTVWDFENDSVKELFPPSGLQSYSRQFEGSWVLWMQAQNYTRSYDVIWAVNVDTNETVQLWDTHDKLRNEGMKIESYGIADGYAFLSIHPWNQREGSQLVELNLETLESRVLMDVNDTTFSYLYNHIGDRYIVSVAYPGGVQVVRAYDRVSGEVTDIPVQGSVDSVYVRSDGDWVLFGEMRYYPDPSFELVAVHVPSGERLVLYRDDYDTALNGWDTDGDVFAVVLRLVDGADWSFPGEQVYWSELPKI